MDLTIDQSVRSANLGNLITTESDLESSLGFCKKSLNQPPMHTDKG